MPTAAAAGARIYYEDGGSGEPIVLLPGLGTSCRSWDAVRKLLEPRFRVLALDPRGTGLSEAPEEQYVGEVVAADVCAVLDAVAIDRAHLVGQSMGGMIAQEVALRHPRRVASLVLVATRAAPDDWSRRVLALRRDLVLRLGVAEQFRFALHLIFSPAAFREMPDRIAEIERRVATSPPDERAYLRQLEFLIEHDARARLGAVRAPTLVVSGGSDVLASPFQGRELAQLIPGAEYVELPGVCHAISWEQPHRLAGLVRSHVERVTASV